MGKKAPDSKKRTVRRPTENMRKLAKSYKIKLKKPNGTYKNLTEIKKEISVKKSHLKKGKGKYCKEMKIKQIMGEFKRKKLHQGKSRKLVTSRKQAIAIALKSANKYCSKI